MGRKVTLERYFKIKMDLRVHLVQVIHGRGDIWANVLNHLSFPDCSESSEQCFLQKHPLFSIKDLHS